MRVDIFEEDTTTPHATNVDLRDQIDEDECAEVESRIQREGRAWIGGGAAPLFYVTRAKEQA